MPLIGIQHQEVLQEFSMFMKEDGPTRLQAMTLINCTINTKRKKDSKTMLQEENYDQQSRYSFLFNRITNWLIIYITSFNNKMTE